MKINPNLVLALLWRLETSFRYLYDFNEITILHNLLVLPDVYFTIFNSLSVTFKRVKNGKLIKIVFAIVVVGWQTTKGPGLWF